MRSRIKYQSILLVLVTLMTGYRQLSVPFDLAIRKPVTSKHYQSPTSSKAAGGAVYFEEEREGEEEDRLSRKQTELNGYFLFFDNSHWEFAATTTIVSIVGKIYTYSASAHSAFRVLRL